MKQVSLILHGGVSKTRVAFLAEVLDHTAAATKYMYDKLLEKVPVRASDVCVYFASDGGRHFVSYESMAYLLRKLPIRLGEK